MLSDSDIFRIAENVIDLGWDECPPCSAEDRERIKAKVREGRRFWRGLDSAIREHAEMPERATF